MDEIPDDRLRRLFANAPVVAPEAAFVAAVTAGIQARRRGRRRVTAVLLSMAALAVLGLAVVLASLEPSVPLAPPVGLASSAGALLLQFPERLGAAVQDMGGAVAASLADPLMLFVLAAVLLPLAGTAWLLRVVAGPRAPGLRTGPPGRPH